MSGSLVIVGLGPGPIDLLTPAAARALQAATDLVGYGPYLDRIPEAIFSQRRHASGNRVEIDRARHALTLAAEGRQVAVVSGGDPGVFAMAAAVFEAIEAGDPAWRDLDIHVEPGITAMLAAAAEVGAPTPESRVVMTILAEADPALADMRTLVIIGAAATRLVSRKGRRPWVYTPRAEHEAVP